MRQSAKLAQPLTYRAPIPTVFIPLGEIVPAGELEDPPFIYALIEVDDAATPHAWNQLFAVKPVVVSAAVPSVGLQKNLTGFIPLFRPISANRLSAVPVSGVSATKECAVVVFFALNQQAIVNGTLETGAGDDKY